MEYLPVTSTTSTECADKGGIPTLPHIIVDLGKIGRKKVKMLKRGEGVCIEQVEAAISQVKAGLADGATPKELVTVVVLYQKKPRKRKLPFLNLLS